MSYNTLTPFCFSPIVHWIYTNNVLSLCVLDTLYFSLSVEFKVTFGLQPEVSQIQFFYLYATCIRSSNDSLIDIDPILFFFSNATMVMSRI